MALTSADVVNQALELIASQTRITALNDGTAAANAASVVYAPVVSLLLRELDPDFARKTGTLVLSGAVTPIPPWAFEYTYPADSLRIRQVRPASGAYDINDPQPIRWNVAFDTISASPAKVILSNQASALAVYTTSSVTETQWDSVFVDAVARRLGDPLAMALSGRPDFANALLEQSARVAATADSVDDGMIVRGG